MAARGGAYGARADDGLELVGTRITNAVRCVPPQNKPEPSEIKTCNDFLKTEIGEMKNLKAVLCLGLISHGAVLRALGEKVSAFKFAHGAVHDIGGFKVFNSYHCSRYNTQTRRLTDAMFESVFDAINSFTQP